LVSKILLGIGVIMVTVEQIVSLLNLEQHPMEGGYFVETYRSDIQIARESLPLYYQGPRALATAIYYLLTPASFSVLHRLRTDEIFHHYVGDPVDMLQLWPDGSGRIITLGHDLLRGMRPQAIVPKGIWQGARLSPGGKFALLGTTMSPGFDYTDYETGDRDTLITSYPEYRDSIIALTKQGNSIQRRH
jgi:uncharacterized protein